MGKAYFRTDNGQIEHLYKMRYIQTCHPDIRLMLSSSLRLAFEARLVINLRLFELVQEMPYFTHSLQ